MAVSITLSGGGAVVVYQTGSGVGFDALDATLTPVASDVQASADAASWVGAEAAANGGFTVEWVAQGALTARDYDASGAATDAAHPLAGVGALAPLASSSYADGAIAYLPNGGSVVGSTGPAPDQLNALVFNTYGPDGAATGAPVMLTAPYVSAYLAPRIAPLAGGGFAAAYLQDGNYSSTLLVQGFAADGAPAAQTPVRSYGGLTFISPTAVSIAGLADGGWAVAWAFGPSGAVQVDLQEYTAAGAAVGAVQDLGAAASPDAAPSIDALADGRYVVAWTAPGGAQDRVFTEQGAALGAGDPAPPTGATASVAQSTPASAETLAPSGAATVLAGSPAWAGAAVLSNHQVAVVTVADGGYGSQVAAEQTYDASGALVGTTALMGYAPSGQTLAPQITALAGGFYEVGYAGSIQYEIYGAAGHRVFVHNAYSAPTAGFTPLSNGGYVVTDSASGAVGLFDANGQAVSYHGPLPDAAGTPTVNALQGGGFVLGYAGSAHFDLFDPSGRLVAPGDLGAAVAGFATGFVATPGGGFAAAWLAPGAGPYGLPTTLEVERFDATGKAAGGPVAVGVDLDPWHTQLQLQAHADGSVAILYSQGGAIWGADVAGGAVGAVQAAGLTGALSDLETVQLPGDTAGFAFLQGGDVWAEIFNPATGAVQRADLGAATGDLTTVHALATAQGGLAVSWRAGGGVVASVLAASGAATPPASIAGDLIGVDSAGHAITLHDNGQGTPVLQGYALSDGLFWTG